MFIENKMKPFYEKKNIQWQSFRDNELWVHDIEMVYTMNDTPMRALFKQCCGQQGWKTNTCGLPDVE